MLHGRQFRLISAHHISQSFFTDDLALGIDDVHLNIFSFAAHGMEDGIRLLADPSSEFFFDSRDSPQYTVPENDE